MNLQAVTITEEEIEAFARKQGLPGQGLLDYMTRIDELLVANLKLLKNLELVSNIYIPPIKRLSLADMKRQLESGQYMPYEVLEFDMSSARTDEKVIVEGDHLTAQTDGTLDGVKIRFNMESASQVPIKYFNPWKQQFFRFYLTHTAQAGKTLYLAIGREAAAETTSFELTSEFKNKVSAVLDSTTDNINNGASYTGSAFSIEEYGLIIGTLFADQDLTLHVDERVSPNTDWDARGTTSYTANSLMGFTAAVIGHEARIVIDNNSGSNTTTCRMYVTARRV